MILYPNMANKLINMYWQANGNRVPLLHFAEVALCSFLAEEYHKQYNIVIFLRLLCWKKGHCQTLTQVLSVFSGGCLVVRLKLSLSDCLFRFLYWVSPFSFYVWILEITRRLHLININFLFSTFQLNLLWIDF